MEAGKHVLCEKPIGLSTAEARQLIDAAEQHPDLKVMEAFMYRHHPQWHKTKELVAGGAIGQLRTIQAFFTYDNRDPDNIRNQPDIGGGGLMDIGCYCISQARFLFGAEPTRAFGQIEVDPQFQTDRLTSGILDFAAGTATFTCATQLPPYQSVTILGTSGRIELEIPFTPTPDRAAVLWHTTETGAEEIRFDPADHYTLQGDLFAESIRHNTAVPTLLEDALANMQAIEAILASATTGVWQPL
jgi:predicted dehydrogenase